MVNFHLANDGSKNGGRLSRVHTVSMFIYFLNCTDLNPLLSSPTCSVLHENWFEIRHA